MAAALYTSRANLTTLVIGKDRGALEKADRIENYFGMAEPISGCELVENTKTQARSLGVELVEDHRENLTHLMDGIVFISKNGNLLAAIEKGVADGAIADASALQLLCGGHHL